ncbi:MAG: hypothetical protein EXX96DRAFT_572167 [Benjaminiella poitrasii]|nr:MAG: hypothetical protein EXX96DRAFT_572167 [Benjaminiella poitrasii]
MNTITATDTLYGSYSPCNMTYPMIPITDPFLTYPALPPPPPPHAVFTVYDDSFNNLYSHNNNGSLNYNLTNDLKRKPSYESYDPASWSPLSSSSYSSYSSFPEETTRAPPLKRSRTAEPKKEKLPSVSQTGEDTESAEDEEELRQKSLERNRLAAYKCRQRKKEWIEELAHRAERMTRENEDLKQLLFQLKEEAVYLKSQLIMHKE